jgi:hypothetical protein
MYPSKTAKVNGGQRWDNGAAQVTDTGIFRMIGLPWRIVIATDNER